MVLGDLIAVVGAIAATIPVVGGIEKLVSPAGITLLLAGPAAWGVTAVFAGLYEREVESTSDRTVREVIHITYAWAFLCWLYFVAMELGIVPSIHTRGLVVLWLVGTALLIMVRPVARRVATARTRVVVVGAGRTGLLIANRILRHPEYRLDLVGFLTPDGAPSHHGDVPVVGRHDELPTVLKALGIDRIIVATDADEDCLAEIRAMTPLDVRIDLVPRLFQLMGPSPRLDAIEGIPLLTMQSPAPARTYRAPKRALDMVLSALAIVLLAPLMLGIALLVRFDSPGPALFRQRRLGEGMREFTSLKFRSMSEKTSDSEHREYIRRTMDDRDLPASSGLFKAEQASSVTRVGAWLRRTSLDELPQLINVLRGDMSLVGPRPCIPYEVQHFSPTHFHRFLVPAGLTGLWQTTARARSTFSEALDIDVAYVRTASFGMDLRLLLGTVPAILRRNASR